MVVTELYDRQRDRQTDRIHTSFSLSYHLSDRVANITTKKYINRNKKKYYRQ
jgi:hypothetical protein